MANRAMSALPDVDTLTWQLIRRVGASGPPLDLDLVVRLWSNLRVSVEDLDGPGYMVGLGDAGAEILIRKADPTERQRYTLAHELGHWVLGCVSGTGSPSRDDDVERWCNKFAAALLMPRYWIKGVAEGRDYESLLDRLVAGPSLFKVSKQAFRLRVAELTPLSLAEVVFSLGETTVVSRFNSRKVAPHKIDMCLEKAMECLDDLSNMPFDVEGSGLVCTWRLVWRRRDTKRWLVCVAPKAREEGRPLSLAKGELS